MRLEYAMRGISSCHIHRALSSRFGNVVNNINRTTFTIHFIRRSLYLSGLTFYWFDWELSRFHYCDVIMGVIVSQITSLTIVYSIVHSGADKRKHQSSASLAFVWGTPQTTPPNPQPLYIYIYQIYIHINLEGHLVNLWPIVSVL